MKNQNKSALNMLGMTGNSSDTVGRINKIKSDLGVNQINKDSLASDQAYEKRFNEYQTAKKFNNPSEQDRHEEFIMENYSTSFNPKTGKIEDVPSSYEDGAADDADIQAIDSNLRIPERYGWDAYNKKYPKKSEASPLNNYQSPSGNKYFSNREDFQRLQNDITGSVWNVAKQRTGAEQAKAKKEFNAGMKKAKATGSDAFTKPLGDYTVSVDELAKKGSSMFGVSRKKGLWDNIHAKRERIKSGSGEKMRKPGSEGAPSAKDLKDSQTKK